MRAMPVSSPNGDSGTVLLLLVSGARHGDIVVRRAAQHD
jgi:hypothetical protein